MDGTPMIYPGSRVAFLRLLMQPRWEDFDIVYEEGNVFAFLGNGFSTEELDGSDITYYLGSVGAEVDKETLKKKLDGGVGIIRGET